MIKACCDKCSERTIVEYYAPMDWLVCEECMDKLLKDNDEDEAA